MLSRTLQWLARSKGARQQCYIVASPDPRIYKGFKPIGKQYAEYMLRFGSGPGIEADDYASRNPTYAYTYNYGRQSTRSLLPSQSDTKHSDWCRIIDTGLKTPDGKTLSQVLSDVIESFPKYDLESDEGIHKAIEDMGTRLGEVATSEESNEPS